VHAALAALALVPSSCAPATRPAPAEVTSATARVWVADRLFFGRAIGGGGTVSDEAWARFLGEVVTPQFPEGLTVWRAEGQWTGPGGGLVREPVFIVEVLHAASPGADSVLEEVARAYKARFRQDAVLRVTAPARVFSYE
jgi:Protein of unknown function (DUF3574)